MNVEALNLSIRKFLKVVGVNSQREIEHAVERALQSRATQGPENLPVGMTLEMPGLKLSVHFDGQIHLEEKPSE